MASESYRGEKILAFGDAWLEFTDHTDPGGGGVPCCCTLHLMPKSFENSTQNFSLNGKYPLLSNTYFKILSK